MHYALPCNHCGRFTIFIRGSLQRRRCVHCQASVEPRDASESRVRVAAAVPRELDPRAVA